MDNQIPSKLDSLCYYLKIRTEALSPETNFKKVCKNFTNLLLLDKDIGIGDLEKHVNSQKAQEILDTAKEWLQIAMRPSFNSTDPALSASLSCVVRSIASFWETVSNEKTKENYLLQAKLELLRLLCAA